MLWDISFHLEPFDESIVSVYNYQTLHSSITTFFYSYKRGNHQLLHLQWERNWNKMHVDHSPVGERKKWERRTKDNWIPEYRSVFLCNLRSFQDIEKGLIEFIILLKTWRTFFDKIRICKVFQSDLRNFLVHLVIETHVKF